MADARDLERRIAALTERIAGTHAGRALDRRRFLLAGGGTIGAAFLAACGSRGPKSAQRILNYAERKNETVERALFRHTSMDVAGKHARDAGDAFPSYFIAPSVPVWDAASGPWTLEVSGMVAAPMRFSLADLQRMPSVTQRINHYCVEGWQAIASWTGVRLRDVAALVRPAPGARYVDFQSFDDDYHESWDLESAMHPQTLVAYGMDGAFLGAAHGGPARIHSPIKLGYKNTKYLTKIVFLPARNGGYWSDQGYEWYGGT
jgi:DMSO/TMAO reductase YedYZ molybdopterin-dependent catalytic subunit